MIRLNEDYYIDVDDMNYTLKRDTHKTYTDKSGKVTNGAETISYFSSLNNAIIGARNYFIGKSLQEGEHSLKEAINIVEKVNKHFEDMLKE